MAIKLPSLKIFSGADARSRVIIVTVVVAVIIFGIFLIIHYLSTPDTTGPSSVATVPSGLQSIPGGKTTPEYLRAVQQANIAASQQAQITGGSAVHTLINVPGGQAPGAFPQQGCVICPSEAQVNVVNKVETLSKEGKLPQENADRLIELAKQNAPVVEYAAYLDDLVKQGKLSPEAARTLLETYKKQYANTLLNDSGKWMDCMIKAGQMPLDIANQLLILQKSNVSSIDYAIELNHLAREGKISKDNITPLLAEYSQQQASEKAKESAFALQQMAKSGEITSDVANQLSTLQTQKVSIDQYLTELNRLVTAGKMTPAASAKLQQDYQILRQGIAAFDILNNLIQQEKEKYISFVNNEIRNNQVSQESANAVATLIQNNTNKDDYKKTLLQLVNTKKLSSDEAKKLNDNYQKLAATVEEASKLAMMQSNNESLNTYTDELKRAVQIDILTPNIAASLLEQYRANTMPFVMPTEDSCTGVTLSGPAGPTVIPGIEANIPILPSAAIPTTPTTAQPTETAVFTAADTEEQDKLSQERQQRIAQLQAAMMTQATQLVAAWQRIPAMQHKEGSPDQPKSGSADKSKGEKGQEGQAGKTTSKKVLIKAGTVSFAVLDTAVNSDYPDTPVMATIVQGPLKDAKLLGKLNLAKDKDKVSLNFNLMNKEEWPNSRGVNAFAIDPDTARTVMANHVDYHYLKRYGSIMATSFLTGYSNAITHAGTSTTGIFGTSTQYAQLSPANRIAVGLGQIGTTLGQATQSYINTPNTVKVNAGVALGILFMADVTEQ